MIMLFVCSLHQYFSIKSKNPLIVNKFYDKEAIVNARFEDHNVTHAYWSLSLTTNENSTDEDQAYYAGYLEGYVTAQLIYTYRYNIMNGWNFTETQAQFCHNQTENIKHQLKQSVSDFEKDYWKLADLIVNNWLKGLTAGYQQRQKDSPELKIEHLDYIDLYLINSQTDLGSLQSLFNKSFKPDMEQPLNCSGVVYPTPDFSDVYFGHATWTGFTGGFVRMMKNINYHFKLLQTKKQRIHYSSSPGFFASLDDMYTVSNTMHNGTQTNLAILETTFGIRPDYVYDKINELNKDGKTVLMWTRVMIAALASYDAVSWQSYFDWNSSWSYNNNYLFFDYRNFRMIKQTCQTNNNNVQCSYQQIANIIYKNNYSLLVSLESVPPYNATYHSVIFDATDFFIKQKFFISVNQPINITVFDYINGHEYINNNAQNYNLSARLNISKTHIGKINKFEDFKKFLRFNDYTSPDNLQNEKACSGISARCDLENRTPPALSGATDGKVTNEQLMKNLDFEVIIGPSRGSDDQYPAFNYSFYNISLLGVPDQFPLKWNLQRACGGENYNESCYMCKHGYNISKECNECNDGFKMKEGQCTESNHKVSIVGVTFAIVFSIILVVLVIFAIIWNWKQNSQTQKNQQIDINEE